MTKTQLEDIENSARQMLEIRRVIAAEMNCSDAIREIIFRLIDMLAVEAQNCDRLLIDAGVRGGFTGVDATFDAIAELEKLN